MTCWIRKLFRRTPTAPVVKPTFARLGVQLLEDRVVPAVSDLDPLFDTDGKQTADLYGGIDDGAAVAVQADGKVVVVGSVQISGDNSNWGIWRYNPNGSPDSTFGGAGYIELDFAFDGGSSLTANARAVAIQSDGKILVGGFSTTATTGRDMTVVRLTTNGTYDSTFDDDGIWTRPTRFAADDKVHSLTLQPDGKLVLAGSAIITGTDSDFMVTRLTTSGVIDWERSIAFNLGGIDADTANAVAVQPDGKVVVVGSAATLNLLTFSDIAVARLTTTGAPDTTFDGDGKLTLRFDTGNFADVATGVTVQPNGKIVIGGTVQTATSDGYDFGLVRLNPNGTYDTTFSADGKTTASVTSGSEYATALVLQPDGKIVLGGGNADFALARFNTDGTPDSTFNSDGRRTYPFDLGGSNFDRLNALALDPSGRIVGVGYCATVSNGNDLAVLRVFGRDIPLVVDTTADGIDGTVSAGKLTLREAVTLANSRSDADTITFSEALNGGTITLGGTRLEVRRPVSITGPSNGITLDGNLQSQVFYFDGRTNGTYAAALRNLTITRGRTVDDEVDYDGFDTGKVGGGIVNDQTDLTLNTVTVSNNQTDDTGGGIFNWFGTNSKLTITNSLIAGNSADVAGGIYHGGSTLTAANTTFSGNTATVWGGGLQLEGGAVSLTNVTATLNRADSDNSGSGTGGFLFRYSGTVTVHNSIVAGNLRGASTADEIAATLAGTSSNNIVGSAGSGGLTNGTNGNQIGVNPLLGSLRVYGGLTRILPLLAGSPAINAGSNAAATAAGLTTDGRGAPFARTFGGTVDIGAFESHTLPLVVDNTGDVDDNNFAAGQLTLREAVRLSADPTNKGITFAESLNGATITLAGTRLEVRNSVTITGPSQGVTIDGNLQSQVFYFDGAANGTYAATLRNLTITRGKTDDSEEIIIGLNSGSFGGGILNNGADLTLENVTVSNCVATFEGGGILNWDGGSTKLTLRNCLISGNSAGFNGGGISNWNWNSATITAVNTTFSGNTTGRYGGAIYQEGGAITLTNVTATLNKADSDNDGSGSGGFVYIFSGTVTLHNSIVAGNLRGTSTADEIVGTLAGTSSNNIILTAGSAGGLTNGTNGNQVGVNPLLQPLGSNGGLTRTHALGQNSPALGKASAGEPNYSVYDQRGTARDLGAADIGAYEVQHPLAPVGVPTTNALLFAPKPSATANEAFVKGLYQSTLLRAPDAGGLANWLAALAGGTSRATVANGFVNSTENRRNQVTFYYRYFLSREPDTGGLNDWVGRLQSGQDEGTVMTGFILSLEFSGNNTNAQFVNLMYYALLGRAADTAGFNDWMNRLATGTSRETVVFFFLRSEEGLNRVVRSLFQAYLKREADASAVINFRTALLSGTTFGQAATSILGGQEFFNNAAANMT